MGSPAGAAVARDLRQARRVSDVKSVRVLRRSPGRLRLHAPALNGEGGAALARLAAAQGVLGVQLSERTGNLLIEFNRSLTDEPSLLALIASEPAGRRPSPRSPRPTRETHANPGNGWKRTMRAETIRARPTACVAALTDFEHYPAWQTHLTAATILERDRRKHGVRVAFQAQVGARQIAFTMRYHFPSPNRIVFEQDDGELEGVHGSWAFRSLGGGRTRATFGVEFKPGWRLNLLLRSPLSEQIQEAVLDRFMNELRVYVEAGGHLAPEVSLRAARLQVERSGDVRDPRERVIGNYANPSC
jgi:ribosome-associated toxin RatA of RatAB toxin-antitoxin module